MNPATLNDYYVGLIRGYCLALNAPTQILRAVDYIIEGRQSRAGELIGQRDDPDPIVRIAPAPEDTSAAPVILEAFKARALAESQEIPALQEQEDGPRRYFKWTDERIEILKRMSNEGKTNKEIAKVLNCDFHAVAQKKWMLGITKPKSKADLMWETKGADFSAF